MNIKAITIRDYYGDETTVLIDTEDSADEVERKIDAIEQEFDDGVSDDDDPMDLLDSKISYILNGLASLGYKFLPYDMIDRYYE